MNTPLSEVYDAFLARIHADDWLLDVDIELANRDMLEFLKMAIFRIKYPRTDLSFENINIDEEEDEDEPVEIEPRFNSILGQSEIQLLAIFMKHEWIKRSIATWEKIKSFYSDRDFSEANHLDKLNNLEDAVRREAAHAYGIYDRARDGKPTFFGRLAGKR